MSDSVNRVQTSGRAVACGIVIGVVCYLTAESLTPSNVNNPGDHDLLLATRLGFIYAPAVGLWLAWLQRSVRRAATAAVVGVFVGAIYMWLCSSRDFLAIMVGFPALLGGLLASALGSNRSLPFADLPARLAKGLFAGFVLGFVYMFTLNVTSSMFAQADDFARNPTAAYVRTMWRAGPVALGFASGFFFPLMRWAVGLTRIRIVFEEVGRQDG